MADAPENEPAPDPLGQLAAQARELVEHLRHYLEVQADSTRLAARRFLRRMAIGFAIALFCAGMLIGSVLVLLSGIALGLAELFGSLWLGFLAGGVLPIALIGGSVFVWLRVQDAASLRRAMERRERRSIDGAPRIAPADRGGAAAPRVP